MADKFNFEKKWKDKIISGSELKDGDLKSVSTGSMKLDFALGRPFVEGSIIELFGENSVGKTTLALEVAKNAIDIGKHVFFVDLERKLREAQLEMIAGLNREGITLVYPDTGEEAGNMMEEFVRTIPGCLIILDSVSALLPEVENAENHDKMTMGTVARLTAKMMRKLTGPAARNKCILVFINHLTATMAMFGSKETVKGGRAIRERASQRIKMTRAMGELIKDDDGNIVGQSVKCKIEKNNMNRPFLIAEVPIIYGKGIYKELDIFNFAKDVGIIETAGKGWYKVGEKNQRANAIIKMLTEDEDYREDIVSKIKEMLN